jgi:hypothetical protein
MTNFKNTVPSLARRDEDDLAFHSNDIAAIDDLVL